MIRHLLLPVVVAATAALAVSAVAFDPLIAAKPPVNQGIVPNQPSDPISDYGLGTTGYVLPGQGYIVSSVKKNDADTLPGWRVANGYRPTPSLLKAGPTVLGHAARLGDSVPGSTSPSCGVAPCPTT